MKYVKPEIKCVFYRFGSMLAYSNEDYGLFNTDWVTDSDYF